MIGNILVALRWSVSLGVKFLRVVPGFTLLIVVLTLVSQLSALLASFLPLKVVILLGSEGVPRYFPPAFSQVDRDVLIGSLSAATVGFFVLHLLVEKLIALSTSAAAKRLLARSQKMVLFEGQDDVATTAYKRYSRAAAGGVFVALALLGMGLFYPGMAGLLLMYWAVAFLVIWVLHEVSKAFRERLETRLAPTMSLTGGIGFFSAFAYLVLDFIFWAVPGLIIAIIALLLSRQVFNHATRLVVDLVGLEKQRTKLNALFFHGQVLLPQHARRGKNIWPLLHPRNRSEWLRPVLTEMVGVDADECALRARWHTTGVQNVAGLRIRAGEAQSGCWLVKVYERNRSSLALHEASLVADPPKQLPAPQFVGTTQVQGFHCLVSSLPPGHPPLTSKVKAAAQDVRQSLLRVEPTDPLVERYRRSRAMLWQRLTEPLLDRLHVAADTPKREMQLNGLIEQLPLLHDKLQELPLVIVNPDLNRESLWIADDGAAVYQLNWGRWSFEPVGSGWPHQPAMLVGLRQAIGIAAETRTSLKGIAPAQVEMAAIAYALEQACTRQRYGDALRLVPRLVERLRQHDQVGEATGT